MTMKTNWNIAKKLPIWAAISAVILIAGIVLLSIIGFNYSAEMNSGINIKVQYDAYITISNKGDRVWEKRVAELCKGKIEEQGLSIASVKQSDSLSAGGGYVEYKINADKKEIEVVKKSATEAQTAIKSMLADTDGQLSNEDKNLSKATYMVNITEYDAQPYTAYLWKGAIAVGVAFVLAFAYVAIRFKFSMGLGMAIGILHDMLLLLSLICIFRIPISTAIVAAVAFSAFYSTLLNIISMNKTRELMKDENFDKNDIASLFNTGSVNSMKTILITSAVFVVILGVMAIFMTESVRFFLLASVAAVAVSTYSSLLFVPAICASFRKIGEKQKQKRLEKKAAKLAALSK